MPGVKQAVVTNNVAEFGGMWRSLIPVDDLFDAVVDSSAEGVRKPDPAIYRLALERELVDRLYITCVHADVEGDTFFPALRLDRWSLVSEEHREADERNDHPVSFQVYERAPSTPAPPMPDTGS